MSLKETKTFEAIITVNKDLTAYGNKYWLQIEDTEIEDNSFLEELIKDMGFGQTFKSTIVLEKKA